MNPLRFILILLDKIFVFKRISAQFFMADALNYLDIDASNDAVEEGFKK